MRTKKKLANAVDFTQGDFNRAIKALWFAEDAEKMTAREAGGARDALTRLYNAARQVERKTYEFSEKIPDDFPE